MPEKYFATIMNKTPIGEDEYIFTPITVTAGNVDPKTKVLTTYSGERYIPITSLDTTEENISGYYTNLIETEKITSIFKKDVWTEALEVYNDKTSNIVYYAVKNGDDVVLSIIDKAKLLQKISDVKESEASAEEIMPESAFIVTDESTKADNEETEEEVLVDPTDATQLIDEYNDNDENRLSEIIKILVEQVIEGKLTPDQLIDLQEIFQEVASEAENAVESVKMQRESLEDEMEQAIAKPQPRVPTPQPLTSQFSTQKTNDQPQPLKKTSEEIDIKELFRNVTKTLIDQDEGARRMITEISRLIDSDERDYAIMLTGDTGVGKTLLMSLISLYIGRPFIKIDSTQLTGAGYVGNSIEESLWKLYEKCGRNKELTEQAIVYFDEIDKKGSQNKSSVNGKQVLDSMLAFIEGTEYTASKHLQHQNDTNTVVLDTSKMIVITSGAFLDVYRQKTKAPMGFQASDKEKPKKVTPTTKDFVNLGNMTDEFMGRNQVIIHLNDMTVESLKNILLHSDNSALKKQEKIFAKKKVKLTTKEGYIKKIAEAALKTETGARSLNSIVMETTWNAYETVCCNPGEYEEVILTEETVDNPKVYQLKRKQK